MFPASSPAPTVCARRVPCAPTARGCTQGRVEALLMRMAQDPPASFLASAAEAKQQQAPRRSPGLYAAEAGHCLPTSVKTVSAPFSLTPAASQASPRHT